MAKQFLAINRLINGWGIVEGKFVYVPLWDPPKDFNFKGYKEFFIASALKAAVPFVPGSFSKQLDGIAHRHANAVSGSIASDWDGDICPPLKVFPWPPRPQPQPQPLPFLLVDTLPEAVKVGLAGFLIQTLGDQIGNKDISKLGAEIAGSVRVHQ